MLQIPPKARTTPAVRAEIARSTERTGTLARRFGVSTETIRKWRKRGPEDCRDRSARPHTAALEGHRRGTRRGLRPAPGQQLRPR